jgi:hypothetical protein
MLSRLQSAVYSKQQYTVAAVVQLLALQLGAFYVQALC